MIAKVHWHSHAISAALQDPHKNVLIVFGSHSAAEHSFRMAIDELAKNLPDYPCLINRQAMTITMAEGGRIQFRVLALTSDCRAIEGRTFTMPFTMKAGMCPIPLLVATFEPW